MRASEFLVEVNLVNKIGDFLQSQAVGRKQIDQAKARKKNIPRIADAVQKLLALKVGALIQDKTLSGPEKETKLKELIIGVMEKSTKVDITGKNKAQFEKPMQDLKKSIIQDPSRIGGDEQILSQISDIVNTAFGVDAKLSVDDMAAYTAKLIAGGMDPQEAVQKGMEEFGVGKKEAEQVASKINGDGEGKSQEPSYAGIPNKTETGLDVSEIITNLRNFLKDDPVKYADDEDTLAVINKYLEMEKVGVSDIDVRDNIIDEIMRDPDLPSNRNSDFESEFKALVYSPGGLRHQKDGEGGGDNMAFVKHKDTWSLWHIGPRSNWRLIDKKVTSERDLKSLGNLDQGGSTALQPLVFRKQEVEGAKNLYRVSSR